MKISLLIASCALFCATGLTHAQDACEPEGNQRFVCGPKNAEDLVQIPGTPWIIASGMANGASFATIDSRSGAWQALSFAANPDPAFAQCQAPPVPATFQTHGLNIRSSGKDRARLYAVGHGAREAIEVFDVTITDSKPVLTWRGCVPMPQGLAANSVASFADGSLVATILLMPGKSFMDSVAKKPTGAVYEWSPGSASFKAIAGTELPGNNGIEVSADERELFVVSSGFQTVVAYSRSNPAKQLRSTRQLPFTPDNVHRGPDGRLLTAGMANDVPECGGAPGPSHDLSKLSVCPRGTIAVAIDPRTMRYTEVVRTPASKGFSNATMVLPVAGEYWIGTFSGNRIGIVSTKPRVIVLTDIGNEPDDSESFVRFLLYSNEFDVEGLVATTSTWQRDRVQPQLLRERIEAYKGVLPNLRSHAVGFPDAELLSKLVRSGSSVYGMQGVGAGKDTEGSRQIITAADRADDRPLWISVWGGAADLAQALWSVRATRTPKQLHEFVAKLRVYSISDQDDAGPWARRNFPDLFWIASVHGFSQYGMATWTGISGDLMYAKEPWPNRELVTNAWLERNIRLGPLGGMYPPHKFIMEGDTPSFLGLITNGLNDPQNPEWGGWGGRYVRSDENAGHRADAKDVWIDEAGKEWNSNQATIFRWRAAFQNDFAARIQWSLKPEVRGANHNPHAMLNGSGGRAPLRIGACAQGTVELSAEGSSDPDGNGLKFRWFQYEEVTGRPELRVPPLQFDTAGSARTRIVVPVVPAPLTFHVILEVRDEGTPALVSYRRALIDVAKCNE